MGPASQRAKKIEVEWSEEGCQAFNLKKALNS